MTLLLTGCLTFYTVAGGPLRCGGEPDGPWIAVDIDHYNWQCGDLVQVDAEGVQLLLPVRDSGHLSRYCVYFGDTCYEIVGDFPEHAWSWDGLSVQGIVRNVTAGLRQRLEVER